jgi:glycosyltransferase involved in cell wall biosynthesis
MSEKCKISIITAVYNRVDCIEYAINSLRKQTFKNYEHIIVDGGSTDGTLELLQKLKDENTLILSERDDGIYDAINKGILLASGDIIGLLHSDDFYLSSDTLENIAVSFFDRAIDVVYGNLIYVTQEGDLNILRAWKSENFRESKLKNGWMPPHPTLFVRRNIFEEIGLYDTSYKISADYEFIVRIFKLFGVRSKYLDRYLVGMRVGGASNRTLGQIMLKMQEDYNIINKYSIGGFKSLLMKSLTKLPQFFKSKKLKNYL